MHRRPLLHRRPEACELLADDPFALLVGLRDRPAGAGAESVRRPARAQAARRHARPGELAAIDLEQAFREKPAIHRFPGAMAGRVRDLAAVVAEDYGGDAARIWTKAKDTDDLRKRIGALPGLRRDEGDGPRLGAGTAIRREAGAKPLVPRHPCLGGVDSPKALLDYQAAKRARKAALRAGGRMSTPAKTLGYLRMRLAAPGGTVAGMRARTAALRNRPLARRRLQDGSLGAGRSRPGARTGIEEAAERAAGGRRAARRDPERRGLDRAIAIDAGRGRTTVWPLARGGRGWARHLAAAPTRTTGSRTCSG